MVSAYLHHLIKLPFVPFYLKGEALNLAETGVMQRKYP
jgi:hypothetical protein